MAEDDAASQGAETAAAEGAALKMPHRGAVGLGDQHAEGDQLVLPFGGGGGLAVEDGVCAGDVTSVQTELVDTAVLDHGILTRQRDETRVAIGQGQAASLITQGELLLQYRRRNRDALGGACHRHAELSVVVEPTPLNEHVFIDGAREFGLNIHGGLGGGASDPVDHGIGDHAPVHRGQGDAVSQAVVDVAVIHGDILTFFSRSVGVLDACEHHDAVPPQVGDLYAAESQILTVDHTDTVALLHVHASRVAESVAVYGAPRYGGVLAANQMEDEVVVLIGYGVILHRI